MKLKEIIQQNNFHFNKRFGQNFIDDDKLLEQIVLSADVCKDDVVLEIGVGGGTLTRALANHAKKVIGYEIDKNLMPVLAQSLSGVENCEVVFKDFMKENISSFEKELKSDYIVVANLPYYITSPIVMKLLEEAKRCKRIVVMVQKEVALRFCAKENTADYGSITPAIDVKADAKIVLEVGRENFYPVPNVDSAVVRIDINENKYKLKSKKAFREAVRVAFLSRRKTLANNLINVFKISRLEAEDILTSCKISPSVRGETLSTKEFIILSEKLLEKNLIK